MAGTTPGPWRVATYHVETASGTRAPYLDIEQDGLPGSETYSIIESLKPDDAKLIAVAPDLLWLVELLAHADTRRAVSVHELAHQARELLQRMADLPLDKNT